MRWHVHGTDVATGQPVTLAVDELRATDAVQAALSKRIIVSHVTRETLRRALLPLSCAAVVVLLPLCGGLYWYQDRLQHQLDVFQKEQTHLTAELTRSEISVRDLRATGASPVDEKAAIAASERAATLERELASARAQAAQSVNLLSELEAMKQSLNVARQHSAQVESAAKEQIQNATDAAAAATAAAWQNRVGSLETANKELAGQVETLKSQLLVAAAKSIAPPLAKAEDDPEPPSPAAAMRWALRTSYDATADFLALHFDKETMQVQPQPDGTVTWSALLTANASSIRIVHDKEKRRVYAVALTVSLAPDAPKTKLEENMTLIAQTLKTFSPGMKDVDARIARATAQLAQMEITERLVLLSDDAKITVWRKGSGEFTWRIESVASEIGG